MVRPKKERKICCDIKSSYFKPRGIPLAELEEVVLLPEELESLRLADKQGLYNKDAATEMGISRTTFERILKSARQKTADALLSGKALKIS